MGTIDTGDTGPLSASALAYRRLEQLIVTLELAPGSKTTESDLIERLDLGRTPVREAIQRLAWEGLIDVRPRAGLGIAPLIAADWLKVLEVRRGVEPMLARSAARHRTDDDLSSLRAIAKHMGAAATTGDASAFLVADKALDEWIEGVAKNSYGSRAIAPLQSHSRRFWYRYARETGLVASIAGHLTMIEAIVAGDFRAAARSMDNLIEMLRRAAQDTTRAAEYSSARLQASLPMTSD